MHISIDGIKIPLLPAHTLVIGAGAAGLNCADELSKRGIDVLLAADDFQGGTSLNAGSDKQTYHKIGFHNDSIESLAGDLFAGGHMHGDTAYALAASSARCFFKLVDLGVAFPHDAYGDFVGYQTDHDQSRRATSAGPLTSRLMAEQLGVSVRKRGVRTLQGSLLRLLTEQGRVCGALLYDRQMARGQSGLTAVSCQNVVLCTGGSADLYEDSVHPEKQIGALGAALRIGAQAANLWSWQYGIASKGVRWNLSGSYQQVLPLYRDTQGRAVLEPWVQGNVDDAVFLKGYQWPFDARKAQGSSRVDLAVHAAMSQGKKVVLDFRTRDAFGRNDALAEEARAYLQASGATQDSPFERLQHMNPAAVELYRSFRIDLAKDLLPIAVCAQHQNGGLCVDLWWRTSVQGLYAAGEVAGCFGAYRPGGSALNETQVGSLRVAQHIASVKNNLPESGLCREALQQIQEELHFLQGASAKEEDQATTMHDHLRKEMSACAGPMRKVSGMKLLYEWAIERSTATHRGTPMEVVRFRDALACAVATLSSMLLQAQSLPCPAGHVISEKKLQPDHLPDTPDDRFASQWIQTTLQETGARSAVRPVRRLPAKGNAWFENVWREYVEGSIYHD